MRQTIYTLILILSISSLSAQPFGGANRGGGQQVNGRFYGKVIDSTSGKAVEYASVQLLQNKMDTVTKKRAEVVIGGMLTTANGEFSLENVPVFGPLKLKITAIGFKEIIRTVSFELRPPTGGVNTGDISSLLGALDKDLGNIKIQIEEKVLGNVTVESTRPGLQLGIDRKVFNVDKNIVSAGGTAVDIMRNVPSLNVDIDGNVTMRNNAPQIFVDGRPTNMTLEQIPADAIQSVELITNPSAKFDASGGTSGILNIVLKKEKKVGYNGNIRANIDSRAKIGLGGDINLRQQKVNFFLNGMYNQRKSISTGTTERTNYYYTPYTYMFQKDRSVQTGNFAFARGGFDYFISNRSTISASLNYVRGQFKPNTQSDIYTDILSTPVVSSLYEREAVTKGGFKNLGSTLSFKHNFPKAGREWTADVTYNKSKNDNSSNIITDTFSMPQHVFRGTYNQLQEVKADNDNIILQTDFVNPVTDKIKVEMGVRAQLRNNSSNSSFYVDKNGKWELQPTSQTNYKSDDQVYAAYVNYSQQFKTFGYQLGLRAESSQYHGELLTTGQEFNIDFPISLFPSVFLSQKIKEDQSIQLNYSRRINRPNFWQLTPITDSSDKLNPSKGNPALRPEFTNSFELSYEKTFKNRGSFLASIYYKHTNDLITRFQDTIKDVNGDRILVNTFINANSSYVTGLELTMRTNPAKWWELTPNFNLYTSDIKIDLPNVADQPRLTSYFVKVNNTFKLPKNISIQLSGDYQSKTVLPPGGSGGGGGGRGGGFGGGGGGFGFGGASASQGYVRPSYGVDMAVRYEFLKNRTASISINMNDILRTRVSDVHSESSFFTQDVFRRRDPRILRINFNWRFGKFDASLFKRKNMKNLGDGPNIDAGPIGQ
ncbi:MAG: outer membrane beta-barrel family protein [Chitinophagaceae bacterium]